MESVSDGNNRYVELVGGTDSETIRIRDLTITIFGNGRMRFEYENTHNQQSYVTESLAYSVAINGNPV